MNLISSKLYPMKSKIFRKIVSKLMAGAFLAIFAFSPGQNEVNAQTVGDISTKTMDAFEQMINKQKALLVRGIEMNPNHAEIIEVNKSLINYFGSAFKTFRQGDIDIQEAFAWSLSVIAPPDNNNYMTENLFDGDDGNIASQGNIIQITPAFKLATAELQLAITSIDISSGEMQSLENFIEFINDNR
ncbi:MAG: hypothetical protein EA411_03585 [Saprospirales bacterium]|nr:MAG: hypothetical protein EA411_03585 [Saprospirales bacterium]